MTALHSDVRLAVGTKSLRWLVPLLALVIMVAALSAATHPVGGGSTDMRSLASHAAPAVAAASGAYFDYIVTILLENENLCSVYYGNATGSPCGTSPTGGVFETGLSNNYSIPLNYNYCNVNPSLPNYLCLSGASNFGCSGYDGGPNSNTCTSVAWSSPNIVDLLVNGSVTWKAYMEDMPSNCYGSDSGNYAVRHDPFVYYGDNVNNATRCNRIIPAGPSAGSDSTFLNDLNSTTTASNYMWLTPNVLNDGHDTSVAYADNYLSVLVPQILGSPVFTTQRAALYLIYDEGYGNPTYATWAGPVVKRYYSSTAYYDAFSFLKTIETNWNLPSLNATSDGAATAMSEFFQGAAPPTPDFTMSASSTQLTLQPGQNGTVTISLAAVGGFTGTVTLTTSSSPSGVTASCSPASVTPGGTSTCSISAANVGSYTVTITGTSGSVVHAKTVALTVSTTAPPPQGLDPMVVALAVAGVAVVVIAVAAILLARRGRRKERQP